MTWFKRCSKLKEKPQNLIKLSDKMIYDDLRERLIDKMEQDMNFEQYDKDLLELNKHYKHLKGSWPYVKKLNLRINKVYYISYYFTYVIILLNIRMTMESKVNRIQRFDFTDKLKGIIR